MFGTLFPEHETSTGYLDYYQGQLANITFTK